MKLKCICKIYLTDCNLFFCSCWASWAYFSCFWLSSSSAFSWDSTCASIRSWFLCQSSSSLWSGWGGKKNVISTDVNTYIEMLCHLSFKVSVTHLCVSLGHSTEQLSESDNRLLQRPLLLLPAHGRVGGRIVPAVQYDAGIFRMTFCVTQWEGSEVWDMGMCWRSGMTLGQRENSAAFLIHFLQQTLQKDGGRSWVKPRLYCQIN